MLVKYRRAQESAEKRRTLKKELEELLEADTSCDEIIDHCQHRMDTAQLSDVDVTVLVSDVVKESGPVLAHCPSIAALEMHYGQCGVE